MKIFIYYLKMGLMKMIYGYARTFREKTSLHKQVDLLFAEGCELIAKEDISGNAMFKPELDKIVENLCSGDELVVCNLSRVCRSLPDLLKFLGDLQRRDIRFKALEEKIDSESPSAFYDFMDAMRSFSLGAFEEKIKAKNSDLGKRGPGRPPVMSSASHAEAQELRAQNKSYQFIAEKLNVSTGAVFNILNK